MSILRNIGMQFKKPGGIPGVIISELMKIGNRPAYENLLRDLMIQASDKVQRGIFGLLKITGFI